MELLSFQHPHPQLHIFLVEFYGLIIIDRWRNIILVVKVCIRLDSSVLLKYVRNDNYEFLSQNRDSE